MGEMEDRFIRMFGQIEGGFERIERGFKLMETGFVQEKEMREWQVRRLEAREKELADALAAETRAREAQTLTVKKTYVPEICRTGAKYGGTCGWCGWWRDLVFICQAVMFTHV